MKVGFVQVEVGAVKEDKWRRAKEAANSSDQIRFFLSLFYVF